MKSFDILDQQFKDIIKEISIDVLVRDAKDFKKSYKKRKVDYLNDIFSTSYKTMNSFKGVYVFVVDKTDNILINDDFFKDTYIYRKIDEDKQKYEYIRTISSTFKFNPKRKPGDGEVILEHEKVLYCGRSDDIFSRIKEHLTSKTYSGTMSMKLGFESRKNIREYLKCYILLLDEIERRKIEKYIHKTYDSYFGEK